VLVVDPGAYTLRVAARDGRGRQGSVDHPVAAALLPAGTFETSDLLLGAPPAAGQSFRPALDPAVAGGGTLATHMELYAADPQALDELAVWLDVIDAGSAGTVRTVRARVSPDRQPGRMLAPARIPVVGLAPVDYVARATVVRGTDELTSVARPFRILTK